MLPDISPLEELLRNKLGIQFGKFSFNTTEFLVTTQMPHGQIVRKTTITEIVRDGVIVKKFEKKELDRVI